MTKIIKRKHHVVPVSWQDRFSPDWPKSGAYYKNISTKKCYGPVGPGNKMMEEYANIVFDKNYRPSNQVEDRLGEIETKSGHFFKRIIETGSINSRDKVDLAYFLAIQACRYPELYESRLEVGKLLAIVLKDSKNFNDEIELNQYLTNTALFPGATISKEEFSRLINASKDRLVAELDEILIAHNYEPSFNKNLVLDAALGAAEHLLGLEWNLIVSSDPAFILSDRPMPKTIGYDFSLGLSAKLGLACYFPHNPVTDATIIGRSPRNGEIDKINTEVRNRCCEWICGPGPWVYDF